MTNSSDDRKSRVVIVRVSDVTVDSESDDRGILGLDPAIDAGALSMRVVLAIRAPGRAADELDEVARWAVLHCPVTDSVRRAVPTEIELRMA